MIKGFTRRFKPVELLTEDQVQAIESATLEVLWQTGMVYDHERALNIFKENGCDVDFEKKLVKFPPELILECIHKTPKYWCAKARSSENDLQVGGDNVVFFNAPGMNTVELETMESRTPTRKEFYDLVKVLDALSTVHFQGFYPYYGFEGVPSCMAIPESCAAKIRNSSKVQIEANVKESDIFNLKMGEALGIDVGDAIYAASPLTVYQEAINCGLRAAENDAFCQVISGCVHGASGPATIAGSVVSDLAECLSELALLQLVNPGMRLFTTDQTNPLNQRTGNPFFDSTGSNLHNAVSNQIWRYWGVPHSYSGAGYTNSKRLDFQSAYERTMNVMTNILTGANIVMLHAGIYGEISAHPLMAILDDDIAAMAGRFIEGVTINDETMAVDLIHEVGPVPGHYLSKAHTRKWWKKEQYLPKSIDMLTYAEWMESGKKSCLDYGKDRLDEILRTHEPTALTDNQEDAIKNILEEAKEHYKKMGLISTEEMEKYNQIK